MCTSDLCNANDYNVHVDRANRLFAENLPPASPNLAGGNTIKTLSSNRTIFTLLDGPSFSALSFPSMNSVVSLSGSSLPSKQLVERVEYKILREGDDEREEVLWVEAEDLEESKRTPRQIRPQGKHFNSL
jgi:hypothetical protein